LDADLVIIDEAQILPDQAYHDFMSFPHVRIIAIGDHGQLKSIGDNKVRLMENPRIRLEEPRRQALGSNLLQFAHALREGKKIRYGKCPGVMIAPKNMFWKDIADPAYDQVIVGFNRTRHDVNREIRKYRGYRGDIPNVGEKLTCLYNNRELGVYNGQILMVEDVALETDELVKLVLDDCGNKYTVVAVRDQFGRDKLDLSYSNKFYRMGYRSTVFLAFAYASSAHKSMGSEYPTGKVYEEVHPEWDLCAWSYTGATRFTDDIQYYR
jgi:exodeoxyribonuclease-5